MPVGAMIAVGWLKHCNKGIMEKKKRGDWPLNKDPLPVVSWTYFFSIWKSEFPHLLVH
jgi:hypothetical protein